MNHPTRTVLLAAAALALSLPACKDSHAPGGVTAEDAKAQQETCEHYLDIKEPVLVKDCLDKKQFVRRIPEAKALLVQATKARNDAIAKLKPGNDAVLAMLKKWADAKAAESTLFVGVQVNVPAPIAMPDGGMHQAQIDTNEIANEIRSMAKDKLPGVDFAVGNPCTGKADNLDFDAKVAVHDSGTTQTIEVGNEKTTLNVLAYDFEIVACYGAERVTLASAKDVAMPLPEGLQLQTDSRSANAIAQLQMDHRAQNYIEGTIESALGLHYGQ